MLSYELAKELRDNGFSQDFEKGNGGIYFPENGIMEYYNFGFFDNPYKIENGSFDLSYGGCGCCADSDVVKLSEACYVPTLSELIEALNDSVFFYLNKLKDGWVATDHYRIGTGNTPEAAVANLWLKLNKK